LTFVFYSPKVASNLNEIGQRTDQRRGSADKTSSSSVQGKKHQYKVFARKTDDDGDAKNDSDNEEKLDKNTVSKDKSLAEVTLHRKRKTDKLIEKTTKKKIEKKGRIEKKCSEEVPPKKNVDDKEKTNKLAERVVDKEVVPEKPIEKHSKKTKVGKEKCEETVSKKAKRGNCSQQASEGGESL